MFQFYIDFVTVTESYIKHIRFFLSFSSIVPFRTETLAIHLDGHIPDTVNLAIFYAFLFRILN